MRRCRRRSWVAAAVALCAVAGCASTIDPGATAGTAGTPGSESLSVPTQGAAAPGGVSGIAPNPVLAGTASQSSAGAAVAGTGSSAGTVGSATASTAPVPKAAGSVPANAPGVTATTVYLGIAWSSQAAAGDRELGATGGAPSYNEPDVFNAYAAYANSHGGFAGRKLKIIYYDEDLTADRNAQNAAACSYFTQDNKVLFLYTAAQPEFYACAAKAKAVGIDGGGTGTGQTYQRYPNLIDPNDIRLDRLGTVTVNGLARAGYFTGKLGLVTWDDPTYRYTISNGYLPALRAHGVPVVQTAYVTVPQALGALGDTTASVSSAITKFRSLGIDHVIIQDGPAGVLSNTGLTFEWMNQAKSQRYYPRYGQNLANSPGWSALPSDQMDKAIAVDDSDYDTSYDVGWHPNKQRELCFKIQAAAGQPVSSRNTNDEGIAAIACDIVLGIQRALNSVPQVTVANILQTWQSFGTSLPSAFAYGTKLFPGRRDGADMVRNEEYFASCQCLKFQGPPYYAD